MKTHTSDAAAVRTSTVVALPRSADVRATSMAEMAAFARRLAAAASTDAVVDAALGFCAERIGVPAAAWQLDPEARVRKLIGVWGAGRDGVARVTASIPTLHADAEEHAGTASAREEFRLAFGLRQARIVPAGDVTIVTGDPTPEFRPVLDAIGGLVADALANMGRREAASRAEADLDLGLAITAHELRGPLVGARAALEQMLPAEGDPSPERRLLRRTASELDGLSRRLDGLLRWSAGADAAQMRTCDLAALVRAAVRTCTLGHATERVVLSAPASLPVRAAPGHLRIAVENLVRNALAYSDETSKVEVDVASLASRPTIEVRDEGPGITPEERRWVFRPFVRGAAGRGRPGDGLGLFITKRVVDAHGGDLACEPAPSGRGSVFRIRLAPVGR